MIVVRLEIIRAIIDSLMRVGGVNVIGCVIITAVMNEFVVVAERLLLIAGKVIFLQIVVRFEVRLKLVGVNSIVCDKWNNFDVGKAFGFVIVAFDDFSVWPNDSVEMNFVFMMTFSGTRNILERRSSGWRTFRRLN